MKISEKRTRRFDARKMRFLNASKIACHIRIWPLLWRATSSFCSHMQKNKFSQPSATAQYCYPGEFISLFSNRYNYPNASRILPARLKKTPKVTFYERHADYHADRISSRQKVPECKIQFAIVYAMFRNFALQHHSLSQRVNFDVKVFCFCFLVFCFQ